MLTGQVAVWHPSNHRHDESHPGLAVTHPTTPVDAGNGANAIA